MRFLDISTALAPSTAAFPGDPPVAVVPQRRISRGDAYNLSALTMSSHAGTHVDPPSHFLAGGAPVDRIDLGLLNGPCRVVAVGPSTRAIDASVASTVPAGTRRVLFRTSNSERWARSEAFFPDYVALTDDGARALLGLGVRLVGVDSLSVESDTTGRFPVHHTLLGAGALILEGLRLAEAPEGEFELRCLPLRVEDGDGGPARAVLVLP